MSDENSYVNQVKHILEGNEEDFKEIEYHEPKIPCAVEYGNIWVSGDNLKHVAKIVVILAEIDMDKIGLDACLGLIGKVFED